MEGCFGRDAVLVREGLRSQAQLLQAQEVRVRARAELHLFRRGLRSTIPPESQP